jgi:hypothetical protein
LEKRVPKIWYVSIIFEKVPKAKSRPIGENSPNLATLLLLPKAFREFSAKHDGRKSRTSFSFMAHTWMFF